MANAVSTSADFILDAYTTALQPGELITEIVFRRRRSAAAELILR